MQTKQRLDIPLKIKSLTDTGEFEGYGSVFGVEDSYSDVVVKGAFQKSLSFGLKKADFLHCFGNTKCPNQSAYIRK